MCSHFEGKQMHSFCSFILMAINSQHTLDTGLVSVLLVSLKRNNELTI